MSELGKREVFSFEGMSEEEFRTGCIERLTYINSKILDTRWVYVPKSTAVLRILDAVKDFDFKLLNASELVRLKRVIFVNVPQAVTVYNHYVKNFSDPDDYSILYEKFGKQAPSDRLESCLNAVIKMKHDSLMRAIVKKERVNGFVNNVELVLVSHLEAAKDRSESIKPNPLFEIVSVFQFAYDVWLKVDKVPFRERRQVKNMVYHSMEELLTFYRSTSHSKKMMYFSEKLEEVRTFFGVYAVRYSEKVYEEVVVEPQVVFAVASETFSESVLTVSWAEMKSAFDLVKEMSLSEDDAHFLEEVVSSYLPNVLESYRVFELPGMPKSDVALDIVLKQLELITFRLKEMQSNLVGKALGNLSSQKDFLSEIVSL